jgi:hypothetical protein
MGADERLARLACTACHAFPPPDVLPRASWGATVYEMAAFAMGGIGAPKAGPPPPFDFDVDRVVRYYEARAPQSLPPSETWPAVADGPVRFGRRPIRLAAVPPPPYVANVRFAELDGGGKWQVVASDMSHGLVLAADPTRPEAGLRTLGRVPNPCHAEMVDLDRDGLRDLIVADLGSVPPSDHQKASVVWLQRRPGGDYRARTLVSGLPRVADVEAADLDGDGDMDLVVAAFGWRVVGSTLVYENRTQDWRNPLFVQRELDPRPGAIHAALVDLDRDGRLDVVELISQHYETVVAHLNSGAFGFRTQVIFSAPHPSWGSSGIDVVDMDGDGDLDVLMTNGDMLDDYLLKPYHGLSWLENRGGFPFVEHPLAKLNGVMRARAADLDGDGDMDVVACAFAPNPPRGPAHAPLPSVVWLEQTASGRFERRTLEVGGHHVTLDVADYDRDGDVDVVVGNFPNPGGRNDAWIESWENLTPMRHQGAR